MGILNDINHGCTRAPWAFRPAFSLWIVMFSVGSRVLKELKMEKHDVRFSKIDDDGKRYLKNCGESPIYVRFPETNKDIKLMPGEEVIYVSGIEFWTPIEESSE